MNGSRSFWVRCRIYPRTVRFSNEYLALIPASTNRSGMNQGLTDTISVLRSLFSPIHM